MPRKKKFVPKKQKEVEYEQEDMSSDESSIDDIQDDPMGNVDVLSEDDKEEVLPVVDSEDDDDDEMDEDEDNLEAWGKRKSTFYNTDFIDEDRGRSYREEDKEAALAEEQDALDIQRRFLESVHSAAFDMGSFAADDNVPDTENNIVATDWASVKEKEKIEVITQTSPEFIPLMKEFKEKLTELKKELTAKGEKTTFSNLKSQLLLHYSINASFYMLLKSQNSPVAHHPVLKRLKSFTNLLNKLKEHQNISRVVKDKPSSVIRPSSKHEKQSDVEHLENGHIANDNAEKTEGGTEVEKRAVTYQIRKNKGLIPHRKKEYRNPRVRHRMKFKKAMVKRKGQVRTPRTETERYGGEYSGIQPYVTKSIKFK